MNIVANFQGKFQNIKLQKNRRQKIKEKIKEIKHNHQRKVKHTKQGFGSLDGSVGAIPINQNKNKIRKIKGNSKIKPQELQKFREATEPWHLG